MPSPGRREFLAGGAVGAAGVLSRVAGAEDPPDGGGIDSRSYLSRLVYSRREVDDWFAGRAFRFAKHHPEWGWLLRDGRFMDGVDGAISEYAYSTSPHHERRMIAWAERPCRINTYGDSFTQCHQVSEGESWQEALARHLGEPVRNFGIGAWSVYQAYLRMRHEEARCPSRLVILNIYDDDHYRNLDAWRLIRVGKDHRFLCPTLPHLEVNLEGGACVERPNPCPTEESFYNLCDVDWVTERFRRDFALGIMLAHANAREKNPDAAYRALMDLATTHGINTRIDRGETASAAATAIHTRAALQASMWIVERTEAFARERGIRVLYVLSFNARNVARRVREGTRFDRPFVDFLEAKGVPYVDLMERHAEEFADFKVSIDDYLKRYYIGHYNPAGNLFTAFAIKNRVLGLLDPPPPAYRKEAGIER